MRLLLVNQFYPPDVAPTGQYLHDLALCLVERGHDVEVLCSQRSYNGGGDYRPLEVLDGVTVRRLSGFGFGRRGTGRVADYASFHAAVAAHALRRPRYDATLSLTTPPYVGWLLPRALGHSRTAHAHWVMDLYPDVLAAHGSLRPRTLVYRALARLTRSQMKSLALVLALGPHMLKRVAAYGSEATQLTWVPLWGTKDLVTDPGRVSAVRRARGWLEEDLALLYSGNMGLGHRLGEFLSAALRLGRSGPVWAFAGDGRRRVEVEAFAGEHPEARLQVLPYADRTELGASLAAADVHLVSLRDAWKGLIVPSKLHAAFTLGRPVIFVGPHDSEPADWILASQGGWCVSEGDVAGLLRVVAQAADPGERARRGRAARAFASAHFDRLANTARIAHLLEERVAASQSSRVPRTQPATARGRPIKKQAWSVWSHR